MNKLNISFNYGHNISMAVECNNEYFFYDGDKILGIKNTSFNWGEQTTNILRIVSFFLYFLYKDLYPFVIDKVYVVADWPPDAAFVNETFNSLNENRDPFYINSNLDYDSWVDSDYKIFRTGLASILDIEEDNIIVNCGHHESHAIQSSVLSGYDESIIITVDGFGHGGVQSSPEGVTWDFNPFPLVTCIPRGEATYGKWGFPNHYLFNFSDHFVIWYGEKNKVTRLETVPCLLGINYYLPLASIEFIKHTEYPIMFGKFMKKMLREDLSAEYLQHEWDSNENLSAAGKIMGLSSYGTSSPHRIRRCKDFLMDSPVIGEQMDNSWPAIGIEFLEKYYLGEGSIGIDSYSTFKEAANFARDWQESWSQLFIDFITPLLNKFKDLPIVLGGGCALNVINNQKILDTFNREVFVPPCPSDRGNPLGALLKNKLPPKNYVMEYRGVDILDRDNFDVYKKNYNPEEITIEELVRLIIEGKIIGIINGRSEIGPRALGNRSIICDPSYPDMKDILNAKVKYREFFRPFAPAVRYEDRDKYFNFTHESPYMSFCPTVKPEYWDKIPSVVHVDKTARIQTVRKEQHELFYSIMTEMERVGKIPIILNTSFNIKGKPILSTLNEALIVLETTELDYVYCEGFLYAKKGYEIPDRTRDNYLIIGEEILRFLSDGNNS